VRWDSAAWSPPDFVFSVTHPALSSFGSIAPSGAQLGGDLVWGAEFGVRLRMSLRASPAAQLGQAWEALPRAWHWVVEQPATSLVLARQHTTPWGAAPAPLCGAGGHPRGLLQPPKWVVRQGRACHATATHL